MAAAVVLFFLEHLCVCFVIHGFCKDAIPLPIVACTLVLPASPAVRYGILTFRYVWIGEKNRHARYADEERRLSAVESNRIRSYGRSHTDRYRTIVCASSGV